MKIIKIPKQIKVGGHMYKVIYPYHFKERTDRIGACDFIKSEIVIGDDDGNGEKRGQSTIEQTFFHEMLHAIDKVYNANKLEEETVERLSEGLYQVLKDSNLLK